MTQTAEIPVARKSRFNDTIADPEGRVYSGIMATETNDGYLYRIDRDGSYHLMAEGFLIPNGMGFDAEFEHLYITDSDRYLIYQFDYDLATGNLSNQKPFITVPEGSGVPDGLTIDTKGYLWSARWGGNRVVRYNREGEEVMKIDLPVQRVSCVTFGGLNYDTLYISTAQGDKATTDVRDRRSEISAGNIFYLDVTFTGKPELLSNILLD
ncbi:gluconolactonase [Xenococcus sp. PCC 7305]|uniref:SMP-30/gluconolactonase/LRE family protein n=1 Tax=Xenococcus sp. PCC 7305 TaxID=102125 RepID=UPI0002AC3C8C|nr:SMP-30/gluconolactonase/LRE family protein [Xenococcus sp. PCC 7305]ELS04260.1 gluconolactonase [Xenococcus sp. PCC 7305]